MQSMRALSLSVTLLVLWVGCGVQDPGLLSVDSRRQGLCMPGDTGGDFGCGCTLNSQCNHFDDDTRLVVCDVPDGAMVGKCVDCVAYPACGRVVGCGCKADGDCGTGLKCNGRTCQPLRARGEYCFHDSDCGSDAMGAMRCLPTKSWCGPLDSDYYCDFNSDCISGKCVGGVCIPGGTSTACRDDMDCKSPLVCSKIYGRCVDKQPDGTPCARNAECQNQCNSFSGVCTLGKNGVICTMSNPDGDCATGLVCTDCGGTFTCRNPGGPCG